MRGNKKNINFKVLSAPFEVFLNITTACNLSCKHCSVATLSTSGNELSTEEWLSLIDEIEDMKVFSIRISGGEPFLHPGFFRIIDHIGKGPLRFSINTNAMSIGRSDAERLKEYSKRIDDIMVSLDGSNPLIHNKLRGDGGFEGTLEGIDALLNNGLSVSLYTTVVKYNYRDIPEIVRLAERLGVTGVKFNELLPMGNAIDHYSELSLSPVERRYVLEMMKDLKNRYNGFISGTCSELQALFSEIEFEQKGTTLPLLNNCSAGTTQVMIRPDGWVSPCDRLYDYKVGNIKLRRLREIWLWSRPLNWFRKRFLMTIDELPGCSDCSYRFGCTGGCPAVPYAIGEGVFSKDFLSCYRVFKGE